MLGNLCKITALALLLVSLETGASEFRRFDPIEVAPTEDESAVEVDMRPVPRSIVEDGVQRIVDSWNGPDFASFVSDRAYDRFRLLDAVDSFAPQDARLRLLSLEDVQTLRQFQREGEAGPELVSEVAVDLVTQVEFEDPVSGFQRRNGTIELILEVTRPLVPASEVGEP